MSNTAHLTPNQQSPLYVSQGTGLPSKFPRICQSIQLQQEQLHGPWKHLPCVVIRRPLGWGLFWRGSSLPPYSTSPLWLLEHSLGATGKRKLPLALYWMDQGWWTDTAVCTSSEESSGLYPHGQTEHCLSDSDTVVHSISLIILLLTGYNHFFCFYFPSLHFHLVLLSICESANVY